jgi:hypothetical protein
MLTRLRAPQGTLRADAERRPLSTRGNPHPRVVRQRLRTWFQPLRTLLVTLTTFALPLVFLYNAPRKQGVSPNAAQFNRVLSTGLRPMDKTLFVRLQLDNKE